MDDERRRFEAARTKAGPGETPPDATAVAAEIKRLRFIAGAMAFGVFGCINVVWFLTLLSEPFAAGGPLAGILVVVAAFLLVAAPFVERFMLVSGRAATPLQRYRNAKVPSLAMRETVGILGLVVVILGADALWGYALGAASLLAIALAWPREADLASTPAAPVEPE